MASEDGKPKGRAPWLTQLNRFMKPDRKKSVIQLLNSLVPYIILWMMMVLMVQRNVPYIYVLLLTIPAAFWLVRIFIIFHDCTHYSFFKSKKANRFVGFVLGVLTFTPYAEWQSNHLYHHQAVGDLDRRGRGDVMTLTVQEYLDAPKGERIKYRLYRNPFVLLIIGPIFSFLIRSRWSHKGAANREIRSVVLTDIAIALIILAFILFLDLKTWLVIQLPIIFLAGILGVWLFYVQHQFENVYWARHEDWNNIDASLKGSSFYNLPRVFQWFSGNIGFHHIHHLRPSIPNYNLEEAYRSVPEVQKTPSMTLRSSMKSLFMNLYDEQQKKMVSFKEVRQRA